MRQWQQLEMVSRLQNQSVAVAPREKNMVRKKQHISKTKEQQQKKHMYLCICACIGVCWKEKICFIWEFGGCGVEGVGYAFGGSQGG